MTNLPVRWKTWGILRNGGNPMNDGDDFRMDGGGKGVIPLYGL